MLSTIDLQNDELFDALAEELTSEEVQIDVSTISKEWEHVILFSRNVLFDYTQNNFKKINFILRTLDILPGCVHSYYGQCKLGYEWPPKKYMIEPLNSTEGNESSFLGIGFTFVGRLSYSTILHFSRMLFFLIDNNFVFNVDCNLEPSFYPVINDKYLDACIKMLGTTKHKFNKLARREFHLRVENCEYYKSVVASFVESRKQGMKISNYESLMLPGLTGTFNGLTLKKVIKSSDTTELWCKKIVYSELLIEMQHLESLFGSHKFKGLVEDIEIENKKLLNTKIVNSYVFNGPRTIVFIFQLEHKCEVFEWIWLEMTLFNGFPYVDGVLNLMFGKENVKEINKKIKEEIFDEYERRIRRTNF